jgi:hypothetical protein
MQILPAGDTGSSAAAGAARSGLDGTGSETGLNAGHSRQLRDALATAQGPDGGLTAAPAACPGRALRTGERADHHRVRERASGPTAPKSKTADETRRAGRHAQSSDQPVNAQHSPATSNHPPGTPGHSTPVTAGTGLNELTEHRTWLTRQKKPILPKLGCWLFGYLFII